MKDWQKQILEKTKGQPIAPIFKTGKTNTMKFEELTLSEKDISSSTFEFYFVDDAGKEVCIVYGEFDGSCDVEYRSGSYEYPDETEVEVCLDVDYSTIEIYDQVNDDYTEIKASKYLIDLIEETITEHIYENAEDYENSDRTFLD